MKAERVEQERLEPDLTTAQDRIRQLEEQLSEAEQELEAATDIINEQQVKIECLRTQLEEVDLKIDTAEATRRKLEGRIADLEDDLDNEACSVPVGQEERRPRAVALQFKPFPPERLKAPQTDLTDLEALVGKLGWEEIMYHAGMLLAKHASEAQGPNKGALEVAASLVGLWGAKFSLVQRRGMPVAGGAGESSDQSGAEIMTFINKRPPWFARIDRLIKSNRSRPGVRSGGLSLGG